jgi:hypothetical protein
MGDDRMVFFSGNEKKPEVTKRRPTGVERDSDNPVNRFKDVYLNGVNAPPYVRTYILGQLSKGDDGRFEMKVPKKDQDHLDKLIRKGKILDTTKSYAEMYMDSILALQNKVLKHNFLTPISGSDIRKLKAAFLYDGDEIVYISRKGNGFSSAKPPSEGIEMGEPMPAKPAGEKALDTTGVPYSC